MIDIEVLKRLNVSNKIVLTKHAKDRMIERCITINDIVNGISTGEIIKQYKDDKPLPSCLVLGFSIDNKYIHIVVSHDIDYIYLITAYYPNIDQWESDFKTRKKV